MTPPPALAATTALFVPGSRPDQFAKAVASGADVVIVDLEDAVRPEDRPAARTAVESFLDTASREQVWVRISSAGTDDHELDLALLRRIARHGASPAAVVLAKAESPDAVRRVEAVTGVPVVALIESARGYAAARELASAVAPSGRLALGALDLALDLGTTSPTVIDLVSVEIVVASRLAGLLPPLASPDTAIDDLAGVEARASRTSGLGFGGALCIHPRQIEPVRIAFRPSDEEVAWASRVVTVEDGAARVDGQMVDVPVIERARRILARVRADDALPA